ncbi:MAG: hypothetical protein U0176_00480 [Bacteroidia bacterium]
MLSLEFPLPDYFDAEKDLLLKHSQPAEKVLVPDGKAMEGHFNSGIISLVFDEIDGEPQHLDGHLEGGNPDDRVSLLIYGIPDRQLDRLVPGKIYRAHWIETVTNTQPFDDDRYRRFVVFRVEGK